MDRALLVGINKYPGCPLYGCVNDITDMAGFLKETCGFQMNNIRLLTDARATKAAIVERLNLLVNGARPGDRLLFHYSGHGAQMSTRNPAAEVDKLDEVICPVDFDWSDERAIRDKDFYRIFATVPQGVEFIWISDSCHSGDLNRDFPALKPDHYHKTIMPPEDINWRLQTARELLAESPGRVRATSLASAVKELNVALISGCKSNETSADAVFNNRPNGALTYFLLKELCSAHGLKMPLADVVKKVAKAVAGYNRTQHPQLEGSGEIAKKPFAGK
ncbi:MAG: caspase family protein [Desulfuromonadales bacterium]